MAMTTSNFKLQISEAIFSAFPDFQRVSMNFYQFRITSQKKLQFQQPTRTHPQGPPTSIASSPPVSCPLCIFCYIAPGLRQPGMHCTQAFDLLPGPARLKHHMSTTFKGSCLALLHPNLNSHPLFFWHHAFPSDLPKDAPLVARAQVCSPRCSCRGRICGLVFPEAPPHAPHHLLPTLRKGRRHSSFLGEWQQWRIAAVLPDGGRRQRLHAVRMLRLGCAAKP